MHPIAQVRPRVHSRHRATRLCDPAPQAWLQRGSAVFDSFGARAEDLSTVCEADAQRMRRSMDTDGDGGVTLEELAAFVNSRGARGRGSPANGVKKAKKKRRTGVHQRLFKNASVANAKPDEVRA